jgi:hypothetical protein
VGIALRRRADAPYMRRRQYRLPCLYLSTENDDTLYLGACPLLKSRVPNAFVFFAEGGLLPKWQTPMA